MITSPADFHRKRDVSLRSVRMSVAVAAVLGTAVAPPQAIATDIVVQICAENSSVTTLPHSPPLTLIGLRPAVTGAQTGDSVDLTQLGTCTITLAGGELPITAANVSINGSASSTVTIDGNNNGRIFNHSGVGLLQITNLTLMHGHTHTSPKYNGGCVYSKSSVSLTSVTVSDCFASFLGGGVFAQNVLANHSVISGNAALYGGGIGAYKTSGNSEVSLLNSTVSGNTGGGIAANSAEIYSSSLVDNHATSSGGGGVLAGKVTLSSSTVSGNSTAKSGGGIDSTNVTMSYSTVSNNTATDNGGGVYACVQSSFSVLCSGSADYHVTINHSTIDSNNAAQGGGIFGGTETITDATISGNGAQTGGGLVSGAGTSAGGILELDNSTVAFNFAATSNGGVYAMGPANIFSSILARNTSGASANPSDLFSITTQGLTTTNSLIVSSNRVTSALTSDPLLTPLALHGGATRVHALLAMSPAINVGASDFDHLTTDQRGVGFPRVVGTNADIGAYERQASDDEIFYDGFAQ